MGDMRCFYVERPTTPVVFQDVERYRSSPHDDCRSVQAMPKGHLTDGNRYRNYRPHNRLTFSKVPNPQRLPEQTACNAGATGFPAGILLSAGIRDTLKRRFQSPLLGNVARIGGFSEF